MPQSKWINLSRQSPSNHWLKSSPLYDEATKFGRQPYSTWCVPQLTLKLILTPMQTLTGILKQVPMQTSKILQNSSSTLQGKPKIFPSCYYQKLKSKKSLTLSLKVVTVNRWWVTRLMIDRHVLFSNHVQSFDNWTNDTFNYILLTLSGDCARWVPATWGLG